MLYAQIKNQIVINTIKLDDSEMENQFSQGYDSLIRIDELEIIPSIDWTYDGEEFIAPQIIIEISDVTPRQMRQALILMGISLSSIENALNTLSEPMQSLARIEWEYSISFQRKRPIVLAIGQILGMNSDQLDAIWALAKSL